MFLKNKIDVNNDNQCNHFVSSDLDIYCQSNCNGLFFDNRFTILFFALIFAIQISFYYLFPNDQFFPLFYLNTSISLFVIMSILRNRHFELLMGLLITIPIFFLYLIKKKYLTINIFTENALLVVSLTLFCSLLIAIYLGFKDSFSLSLNLDSYLIGLLTLVGFAIYILHLEIEYILPLFPNQNISEIILEIDVEILQPILTKRKKIFIAVSILVIITSTLKSLIQSRSIKKPRLESPKNNVYSNPIMAFYSKIYILIIKLMENLIYIGLILRKILITLFFKMWIISIDSLQRIIVTSYKVIRFSFIFLLSITFTFLIDHFSIMSAKILNQDFLTWSLLLVFDQTIDKYIFFFEFVITSIALILNLFLIVSLLSKKWFYQNQSHKSFLDVLRLNLGSWKETYLIGESIFFSVLYTSLIVSFIYFSFSITVLGINSIFELNRPQILGFVQTIYPLIGILLIIIKFTLFLKPKKENLRISN